MGGPVCVESLHMACRHNVQQSDGNENADDTKTGHVRSSGRTSALHKHSDTYYCEKDLYVHIGTRYTLYFGCFYHQNIGSTEAKLILKSCPVGTFLVRDSSDSKYLYTISVKTSRGPTSIRIFYERGRFTLDADEKSKRQMPKFTSLLELIDYYIRKSQGKKSEQCRFLDKNGKKDLPIVMSKPKITSVPTLKHLTRTLINRSLPAASSSGVPSLVDDLPLPKPLRSYLKDYPYLY
ncbi:suppressor of cytokine signaling 2-like [Ruditapes philippinarum]|uniref:suppressor of cytokine signaling 2-like n=1 Tax=Ruditapes philippinarum TaxID=129788 RepID=UPI00295B2CA9|nr:suppressor of cytokine signaling 2-like [Ruditapes philippinarum]